MIWYNASSNLGDPMARPSIAALIAKHKEKSEQKKNNSNNFDNDVYPFFNIPENTEAEVRLLPDANEENDLGFRIERFTHQLPINGKIQKGIPCLQMYGIDCPICERSMKYYKVARDNKENTKMATGPLGPNAAKGKLYWRNVDSIARGVVLKDPLPVEEGKESHVGKVRKMYLLASVVDRIIGDLSSFGADDPEPWDLENGVNFIFRKTIKNGQPNYSGSGFARKSAPVSKEYKDNVKLLDLKTLLPQNPGLEKILALLEAHDTGKDVEEAPISNKTSSAVNPSDSKENDGDDKIPFEAAPSVVKETVQATETTNQSAPEDDILARIKNRNKNKGA